MCVSTSLGVSSFSMLWPPSGVRCVGSAVEIDELLERYHLVPAGRGRHDDQRVDACVVPLLDAISDLFSSAVERDLRQPAIGHELRDLPFLARGDYATDRLHFVLEARL